MRVLLWRLPLPLDRPSGMGLALGVRPSASWSVGSLGEIIFASPVTDMPSAAEPRLGRPPRLPDAELPATAALTISAGKGITTMRSDAVRCNFAFLLRLKSWSARLRSSMEVMVREAGATDKSCSSCAAMEAARRRFAATSVFVPLSRLTISLAPSGNSPLPLGLTTSLSLSGVVVT